MDDKMRYDLRGVSATKDEVHEAIKHLDKGLYPKAFCKILPDIVAGDAAYCNVMHADTAGTKTSLAYLYWKETGDLSVWKGIAQDAIVMNIDDMACVGCIDDIILSSTIGRNKNLIPGEVISTIINAAVEFTDMLRKHGCNIHLAGGETADVGDIVRTIDVGYTTFARLKRKDVIVNDIRPGDVVVGLASDGLASYETGYNGGMGSNGLTSARHDVLAHSYANNYPDSFDANTPKEVIYSGSRKLTETIEVGGVETTVGKLILSPTRTYIPILQKVLSLDKNQIHGIIHCSGGAQTKVSKFLNPGIRVVKDDLFETPYLFKMIQKESGTSDREMYQVFNMGHRLELYLNEGLAQSVIDISNSFGVDARIVGRVESAEKSGVTIVTSKGQFDY